jgi:hypothetical protein
METLRVKVANEWEEIEFGKRLPVLISESVSTSQTKHLKFTQVL